MRWLVWLLCLCFLILFPCGPARGQSSEELLTALAEAETERERYGLLYQLTRNYTSGDFRDAPTAVQYGEKAYNSAKTLRDPKLMAAAAYALALAYKRDKNPGRAETYFRIASQQAMKTGNAGLILKATAERTRIASRRQRYRDAVKINEDALDYFTQDGNDIETLRARLEIEEAELRRRRAEVEEATTSLSREVERLEGEKNSLESANQDLERRNRSSTATLREREEELMRTQEEKQRVEERVAESRQEIRSLSREALEQRAVAAQAREELAEEALVRQAAEVDKLRAEALAAEQGEQRNRALAIGGVAGLLALSLALFAIVKIRSSRKLSRANEALDEARRRSDDLLENILPVEIARELKATGEAQPQRFEDATVLFCDFVNFTQISEQLGPDHLVRELDVCFRAFDEIVGRYEDVEKIKTIGDAYLAAGGLSQRKSVPYNMVATAIGMQEFLARRGAERQRQGLPFFTARIGLHTGPVVGGVVGARKFAYDIWGDTVNVAARVEAAGEPGRINVSESTYNLIRYRYDCDYRGKLEAKNKGMIDMYFVKH